MAPPGTDVIRVMLIDDHQLLRVAVRQALDAPDIEVVAEAATAEEGLRVAPLIQPDVLLLDITLPGMDGLQLVRELSPRLPNTRIVMLSASGTDRNLFEAMRNGASGYLTKDLSADALVRAVRSAHAGELAMDRLRAARLVRRLLESSRSAALGEDDPGLASLSPREGEILRLLADGLTDREIGEALTISSRTVETHVGSILRKLGARNRAEAARRYLGTK